MVFSSALLYGNGEPIRHGPYFKASDGDLAKCVGVLFVTVRWLGHLGMYSKRRQKVDKAKPNRE